MNWDTLRNPVMVRKDNLRDPSVFKAENGYHIFYSRYANREWYRTENWTVAHAFTEDFVHFTDEYDISEKGFASPGDLIRKDGKYLLPFQSYPDEPARLCYSLSDDLVHWTEPVFFLEEAAELPWNSGRRVIDPTLVRDGDRLHCFFVGSDHHSAAWGINAVGHAYTDDPDMKRWSIATVDKPLIGTGERNADGAENVAVFRKGKEWILIYSEGLKNQHLAWARSKDLMQWDFGGEIQIERQKWTELRYGAPYIWEDNGEYVMILMGEDMSSTTALGLLRSQDGIHWKSLPESGLGGKK